MQNGTPSTRFVRWHVHVHAAMHAWHASPNMGCVHYQHPFPLTHSHTHSPLRVRARRPWSASAIAPQTFIHKPRVVTEYYAASAAAAGEEEGEEGEGAGAAGAGDKAKAFTAVAWLLSEHPLSVEEGLPLSFLDYLLLGTPAAPLRKALNDSRLGEAVIGGGMDDELRQPVFSVGLKGVDPANLAKVEELVLAKLAELAESGFSDSATEAALNTIEFSLRENNTGSFPRGLSLMLRSVGAWIYDEDPFEPLQWEGPLAKFKADLAAKGGKETFGPLIKKYLLKNNHK